MTELPRPAGPPGNVWEKGAPVGREKFGAWTVAATGLMSGDGVPFKVIRGDPAMGTPAQQRDVIPLNEQKPGKGVVRSTEDFAVGVSGRLVAVAWKQVTHVADITFTRNLLRNAHAGKPQPLVFLQFVPPSAQTPGAREREAVAKLLAESAGLVSHSATVYVGQGFRAAMIRSIVIGINALARQPYPIRVFATLSEASSWIEESRRDILARSTIALVEQIMRADLTI